MQDGHFNHIDASMLHWQYCTLPPILLGELHRWPLPSQGDFADLDYMVPTVAFQEGDGEMRSNSRAEDHARVWLRVSEHITGVAAE